MRCVEGVKAVAAQVSLDLGVVHSTLKLSAE
jgi:hypothetical protein